MDFSSARVQWFLAALFVLAIALFNLIVSDNTIIGIVLLVVAGLCAAAGL